MSNERHIDTETAVLGNALRALPPLTPPVDVWPRLRASLPRPDATAKRAARRRQQRWLALAAMLALAAVLLGQPGRWGAGEDQFPDLVSQPGVTPEAPSSDTLAAQSAHLEALLDWIAPGDRSAEALAIDLALVDRMQWVDHLLASPATDAATREVLWRERVELLSRRLLLSEHESLAIAGSHPALATTL